MRWSARSFYYLCLAITLLTMWLGCRPPATEPLPEPTPAASKPRLPRQPSGGGLEFLRDFDAGIAQARRQGKPLLVFLTHPESQNCYELAEEALRHPKVIDLSHRFVCVLINVEEHPELCQRLDVQRFPTLQFLSAAGHPLNRLTGKRPAYDVAMEMQTALQSVARRIAWPEPPAPRS